MNENATVYTITASRPIGGGRSEDVSSETTLGHAHSQTYVTREAAEEDVAHLVSTWDADWWGECPVFEVEEHEQEHQHKPDLNTQRVADDSLGVFDVWCQCGWSGSVAIDLDKVAW